MLVAIRFGTLVRLLVTVAVLSVVLFLSVTHNGSTDAPTPPQPVPTEKA
ncbi:hypothetical protein [Kibdelosporangium phytohabitans]|nr:hypothetical protein [Kibdelosporangium phytohabitans]MBE1470072.1 hypothetical protein [Kibdelosporangium phytohabitans]